MPMGKQVQGQKQARQRQREVKDVTGRASSLKGHFHSPS